ncbi:MAG: 2-oxoglutarate dehydrogenase complex dihydrolipoyllysine-residue succinyltransferase [Gammaproteobacteria bacterium]|nr:2-oxoglutarate dehydrogenase complex dihydrolipoyllysine-residue succinyltransferase [Gammaproteobacteria bacterium]MDE0441432.1 2-oxoglutarate dehydrogenase complex dihydrolipoyllysine-residue succinyltransferase [Gammaproteobacteria bacterium]
MDEELIEIRTPTFAESISEGTVAVWHKAVGESVKRDDVLLDIETDKVVIEIFAPTDGVVAEIVKGEGDVVESEDLLGRLREVEAAGDEPEPVAQAPRTVPVAASPAARKLAAEEGIELDQVDGSGRDGRITKDDVQREVDETRAAAEVAAEPEPEVPAAATETDTGERVERRVPMTRLRASIAARLVEAQQTAAMLTTFNEVDMGPIMTMRRRYGDEFRERHNGTKLGFMSFFVRASVEALKRFPAVNATIDGNDIVYHGYYDIGVAVSTDRGLVVPVIRDADALGMHQIEDAIVDYSGRAQDGKLALEDMQGGTFTISNGGVFGSLLSTPILNPPQTGILGMHKIEERPMVVDGQIVARPMMYLALSYDHRLIDGREAVSFLVTVKQLVEDPARILLEL